MCPARRGQPAPPRLDCLTEDTCSLVQENLSENAVRSRALVEVQNYMPAEVVYEPATGYWRLSDPCPRGRRWQRASCARRTLYVH